MTDSPRPEWCDTTCVVCPAQVLGPGGFDVTDRPGPALRYDPATGHRIDARSGVGVCVHRCFVAMLRAAGPGRMVSTLARAEATASCRFASREVVTAIRRALAGR